MSTAGARMSSWSDDSVRIHERERRSRHMADKDLALAQADAKRWRAEVEHVVLNAPLELLPFLAEPDDGGVH